MHFHMTMLACLGAVRAYEDPADRYVLRRADRLLVAGVLDSPDVHVFSRWLPNSGFSSGLSKAP